MKERYHYIDRLKGLAILLVVMGHFLFWGLWDSEGHAAKWIYSFHMPLFMFLSGLVATPPHLQKYLTKLASFWMPMVTVGVVWVLYSNRTITQGFHLPMKAGYWYLYVLGFFYLFLMPFRLNKVIGAMGFLIDVCGIAFVMGSLYLVSKLISPSSGDILSIGQLKGYWPWFMIGYVFRKYNLANCIIRHSCIYTILLIAYFPIYSMYLNGVNGIGKIVALFSIVILLFIFKRRETENTAIECLLEKLGRLSLDVYIYHFFIVRYSWKLANLGKWFNTTGNVLLEMLLTLALSIVTIVISISMGWMIRQSAILKSVVYGEFIYKLVSKTGEKDFNK